MPDGALDGTLTATLVGPARTVRQLVLDASGAASGRWDTVPGNGYWVVGAADTWDGALKNAPNDAVNFQVSADGSFAVFATDYFNAKFLAGTTLTLTATFTDDTVATASVTVPVVPTVTSVAPTGGAQGAAVSVTVSGTNIQAGATLSLGAGVTVTNVTVPSATQLLATLNIAVDAAVGLRDVTVTNPGGGGATLAGGFSVTAPGAPPPPPPGVTLAWNGKIRDRVYQGEGPPGPDGALDGTLTASLVGPERTVKQLVLAAGGAASGRWDTIPANGYWMLGAAQGWDAATYNTGNSSVSFTVPVGGSFAVFATDYFNAKFVPGTTLTLTVTFTDDTVATASVLVP